MSLSNKFEIVLANFDNLEYALKKYQHQHILIIGQQEDHSLM
jgi:hypothetical protein